VRSNAGHSTSCRHGTETNRNAPRDRLHGRLDIAVYRAALEGGWPGCRPEKLNATRRQVGRLRRSLPGGRRWSIDRLGRQRLRQFDAREFFHHPRIRADRSAPLPISERGAHGRFSLHRRLLESPHAATQPALSFADQMRKETQWPQRDRLRPNPCITSKVLRGRGLPRGAGHFALSTGVGLARRQEPCDEGILSSGDDLLEGRPVGYLWMRAGTRCLHRPAPLFRSD
jgi:hypothetical protein